METFFLVIVLVVFMALIAVPGVIVSLFFPLHILRRASISFFVSALFFVCLILVLLNQPPVTAVSAMPTVPFLKHMILICWIGGISGAVVSSLLSTLELCLRRRKVK